MLNKEENYRFGFFYYNKEDDRLFVTNIRNAAGVNGKAVNHAHPIGKLIGFMTAIFLIGAVAYAIIT